MAMTFTIYSTYDAAARGGTGAGMDYTFTGDGSARTQCTFSGTGPQGVITIPDAGVILSVDGLSYNLSETVSPLGDVVQAMYPGEFGDGFIETLFATPDIGGDPIPYTDYPETSGETLVTVAIDVTGIAHRAYKLDGTVYSERRTYDTQTWTAIANWAGKHPAAYWWYGDEHVVYVAGTDSIRDRNVRTGEEVIL